MILAPITHAKTAKYLVSILRYLLSSIMSDIEGHNCDNCGKFAPFQAVKSNSNGNRGRLLSKVCARLEAEDGLLIFFQVYRSRERVQFFSMEVKLATKDFRLSTHSRFF
jgi:hypothetical protein